MFEAHSKRMALTRMAEFKNSMIAGVWGNSNFDEGESRSKMLDRIDDFYQQAVDAIYGNVPEFITEEEMEEDPFFAAMKRPAKLKIDKESVKGVNGG